MQGPKPAPSLPFEEFLPEGQVVSRFPTLMAW
jgi:hypothetical protein